MAMPPWTRQFRRFVGAALARHQGLRTLARINTELSAGRMPTAELADGLLILLAGAVLLTPGFLTDALGLLLLIPLFRRVFKGVLTRYFKARIVVPDIHAGSGQSMPWPDGSTGTMSETGPHPSKYVENEALRK